MDKRLCTYCNQNLVVGRGRKYSPEHARETSAIWEA